MNFDNIDKKLAQLNSKRPLTSGELERLKEEFLIEFTYNSNAIEGNTLTLQETALILNEGITIAEKPLREHLEVIGHKDAYFYVESLVKKKTLLSERVIKDIHSIVLMDKPQDKGVYRSVSVRIMGAMHTPPQPWEIPIKMESLLLDYKNSMQNLHPIERISLFHLQFERVHPFIDGNGRTGRLVLNLELMKAGYPAINVKFSDRHRYYDCFEDYHNSSGNPQMLVALISQYVDETLDSYLNILGQKN